jgi:3-polyprenyl-4-hydroxybenzoate decarboxylase
VTRAELDALIDAALVGVVGGVDPLSDDAAAAREEAQLLEAEARSFADAVDRDGKRVPYGSAVVLEGPRGVAVVQARDYADAPIYWHTVVGGSPDRITSGPELMEVLAAAAHRSAPRTA